MAMSNIRVDTGLKNQAAAILADFGLSHTQAVKLFFNQIVATRKVPLSFDYEQDYSLKPSIQAQIIESDKEIDRGDCTTLRTESEVKDFFRSLGRE
ncbi:type II toxin-antitoxin system RelB/DinJ family antitoxin [Lonepinella koalarum]|uniref:type II toxin-antitoxin system RelB/DinJ family antitoxin n=1 Tax=Lonepinella koalarum TaxID=53417 RepID=UPI003F6E2017